MSGGLRETLVFDRQLPNEQISMLRTQLLQYCRFLGIPSHDAEDLAQTTLLKALPALEGKEPHPNLPALLRRIAKNAWRDEIRKNGRQQLYNPDEFPVDFSAGQEDSSALEEALQKLIQLTPQQQIAVLLCDVFQYTLKETGEWLDISQGAVKATLHRARNRLASARNHEHLAGNRKHRQINQVNQMDKKLQKEILTAYVSAFQSANIRMLVQLYQNGTLDAIQATAKVLNFAQQQSHQAQIQSIEPKMAVEFKSATIRMAA